MAKTTAPPKAKNIEVGRNVACREEGGKLIIEVDLSEDTQPSGSGKTLIVATTRGNKRVTDDWFIGLNVYKYAEKKTKKEKKS